MQPAPDFNDMPIEQLRAWRRAAEAASITLQALGGGEVAIFADDEGVSLTVTIFFSPKDDADA